MRTFWGGDCHGLESSARTVWRRPARAGGNPKAPDDARDRLGSHRLLLRLLRERGALQRITLEPVRDLLYVALAHGHAIRVRTSDAAC
jgi:hypothetical protein